MLIFYFMMSKYFFSEKSSILTELFTYSFLALADNTAGARMLVK